MQGEEIVQAPAEEQAEAQAEAPAETEADEETAVAEPEPEPPAPPEEEEAPPLAAAPDPTRGQQVFFQNGCNVCHGDTGEGGIGPTIAQTGFSVAQVLEQYRNPRGFMPAFAASVIPDEDVASVHAWLQTLPLPDVIVPGEGTP